MPSLLTKDQARYALAVVDHGLSHVCGCSIQKKGEGAALPFENALLELLLSGWAKATKKSTKEAAALLAASDAALTTEEVGNLLKRIGNAIKTTLGPSVSPGLANLMLGSYKSPRNKVMRRFHMSVKWDQVDDAAVSWLHDHHMYWIESFYDKQISGGVASTVAEGLQQGLGRVDIGKMLKTYFDDYPGIPVKPQNYWEGTAANAMNRSRGFGLLHGYEVAGVRTLKLAVVDDERTSAICHALIGTEIPLNVAVYQRDRLMEAENPEDVKTIAPWLRVEDVAGKSNAEKIMLGIGMPPYHFHCRTGIIAA